MTVVIGLTGSIGMGKSTASEMLKKMGCAIHNADKVVHNALSPHGKAFEEVALTFPEAWDKKTHTINRKKLGEIVFNDSQKREQLEDILHPIVQEDQKRFILAQTKLGRKFTILEIPLLFETGADERVDYTAVVSAPYHVQRQRVLRRPNMTEDKFNNILNSQMPDEQKRALADFVIPTGLGLGYTRKHLNNMLKAIASNA